MEKLVRNRIIVIFLIIYLAVMVTVTNQGLIGDVFNGFYWRSGGWALFPIPINPSWFGWIVTMAYEPLTFFELPVYLIFVGHGIWIFWEVVGILYIVYPWVPFLHPVAQRGKSIVVGRLGRSG